MRERAATPLPGPLAVSWSSEPQRDRHDRLDEEPVPRRAPGCPEELPAGSQPARDTHQFVNRLVILVSFAIHPRVGPEDLAGRGDSDDDVPRPATGGEPALQHERLLQTRRRPSAHPPTDGGERTRPEQGWSWDANLGDRDRS